MGRRDKHRQPTTRIASKYEELGMLRARCRKQAERIKELEAALEGIWPFIEEDFPKGTGDNHGTCASDLYVLAARQLEQALKDSK